MDALSIEAARPTTTSEWATPKAEPKQVGVMSFGGRQQSKVGRRSPLNLAVAGRISPRIMMRWRARSTRWPDR
jgi:hypothetical protein